MPRVPTLRVNRQLYLHLDCRGLALCAPCELFFAVRGWPFDERIDDVLVRLIGARFGDSAVPYPLTEPVRIVLGMF